MYFASWRSFIGGVYKKQTTQKSFFTILFSSVLLFIYNFPYFAAPPSSTDSLRCCASQADRLSPSGSCAPSAISCSSPPSSEQRRLRLEPLRCGTLRSDCCGGTGCGRTWWSRRDRAGRGLRAGRAGRQWRRAGCCGGRRGALPDPPRRGEDSRVRSPSWKTIAVRRITWAVRCDVLGYVQLFV